MDSIPTEVSMMITEYMDKFETSVRTRFDEIQAILVDCGAKTIRLWAGVPSYYLGDRVIRVIVFRDHVNIESSQAIAFQPFLPEYKFTPKGMLQIFHNQTLPVEMLRQIAFKTYQTNEVIT
jgi:hypothetical protein